MTMSREEALHRAPASLRRKPRYDLRLQDAVVAQKPLWQVTGTGLLGAALMWWFLPVFCVINVIFLIPVAIVNGWVEAIFTSWLFPFLRSVWPYIIGSILAGGLLGALRAASARSRTYVRFMRLRWGLDTFAAAGIGLFVGIWGSISRLDGGASGLLGAGALVAGCFFHFVWQRSHDAVLRWIVSEKGVDYAREIKEFLLDQKELGEFELVSVSMDDAGCVDLYGVWPDRIVQGSIETALGRSPEVRGVRFHDHRVSSPSSRGKFEIA